MALIDKGTHLQDDETGANYAKASSVEPPHRRKRKKLIKPADSDILFGLFLEKMQGRLTLTEISDATGWKPSTLCTHFKAKGFHAKAEQILAKTLKANKSITAEAVATNLAARILKGAEEHDESVEDLMTKTRQHFRRMKGGTILKHAKEIKTVVDMGRQHYRKDVEAVSGGAAPVLNVNFLLGISGAQSVSVAVPRRESEEES